MGLIPGLTQWVKYPALLWLWHRLAAAADSTPSLGTSYATGMALKETDWKPGLVPALPVTDSMTEGKIFMFSC